MRKDEKNGGNPKLVKVFIYLMLILLAVTILVPVAWVFVASIKENSEFYGNPWTLPQGFHFQNFVDAWQKANMGEYMLNSVIVTALALALAGSLQAGGRRLAGGAVKLLFALLAGLFVCGLCYAAMTM